MFLGNSKSFLRLSSALKRFVIGITGIGSCSRIILLDFLYLSVTIFQLLVSSLLTCEHSSEQDRIEMYALNVRQ